MIEIELLRGGRVRIAGDVAPAVVTAALLPMVRDDPGSGGRPGLVWSEDGRIELDPDERVQEVIRLVFAKFPELGGARQVFFWLRDAALKLKWSLI